MTKSKIRVLFISRKWPPAVGGMETYGWEMAAELKKTSEIELETRVLPGRSDGRPPHALSVICFFLSTAVHLFRHAERYDVIHFGDMVQIGLACVSRWRAPGTRNFVALHGLDVIYGRRSGFLPRTYQLYTGWARSRDCVDCFIANSRNTARLLTDQGFGPVAVVPLGVRLDESHERPPIEPIGHDRFVLFFGRIFRRKGPRWFAEHVLSLLPDDVVLVVVGTVWDEADGEFLRGNSRVRMPGSFPADMTKEGFELMKRMAAAIVMPNVLNPGEKDVEGFGLTALEAADNGAPLVAADLEGIRDAVIHGRTGFLIPAEEASAWADKINGLLQWTVEQRQQFADGAGEALRQQYSWERVARDTVSVYNRGANLK